MFGAAAFSSLFQVEPQVRARKGREIDTEVLCTIRRCNTEATYKRDVVAELAALDDA